MRKIHCLFERDWSQDVPARPELNDGMGWVQDPHVPVVPTEKYDGTCVLITENNYWKRRTLDPGDQPPPNFELAAGGLDENGQRRGWVPVEEGDPNDQYHMKGIRNFMWEFDKIPPPGTYELVGPKIQDNPYDLDRHMIWRHGKNVYSSLRFKGFEYDHVRNLLRGLRGKYGEGFVLYELGGSRLAKITRRDFGLEWPIEFEE